MKNWWLKFGCFLTGYNYQIVMQSSEISAKAVKKYTSALLIICILWGFIGYAFTQRYVQADLLTSVIGATVAIIIVIQIERLVILSMGQNPWGKWVRIIIGCIMACIGSVIIDQIIFKEDVEKKQLTLNQQLVDSILPRKTAELKSQIRSVDTLIMNKEVERAALQRELDLRPTISLASSVESYQKDSTGNFVKDGRSSTRTSQVNPKLALMQPLQDQINAYINRKADMETKMISMRDEVTKEVKSKTGFLDELEVLFSILFASKIALGMWLLWFLLLLAIELFVLLAKYGDSTHDYERTVLHQMEVKLEMLKKLRGKPEVDNFLNNK